MVVKAQMGKKVPKVLKDRQVNLENAELMEKTGHRDRLVYKAGLFIISHEMEALYHRG